jgi:hypothetical protein
MSGLDNNTYYGKISKLGRVFNKLDPNQVREAIGIAQANFSKDIRDVANVDLQYDNLDMPKININKKIEETKQNEKSNEREIDEEER